MTSSAISSVQNPRVKAAVRLRQSAERKATGRFVFEGDREIARALDAGVRCLEAFFDPSACQTPERRGLLSRLRQAGCETLEATSRVFEKLAFGERHEGIVVVAQTPQHGLAELKLPPRPLVAVLEAVEKPGNLGAVLRSADGAGVSAVIAADPRTDLFNHHTVRNSLGTVFSVPTTTATARETVDWLHAQGLQIVAARLDAAPGDTHDYTQVDLSQPTAIVLGSEAHGLSSAWHGTDVTPIRVPMRGVADSLNVSAAAAVLFYEALRQRTVRG